MNLAVGIFLNDGGKPAIEVAINDETTGEFVLTDLIMGQLKHEIDVDAVDSDIADYLTIAGTLEAIALQLRLAIHRHSQKITGQET